MQGVWDLDQGCVACAIYVCMSIHMAWGWMAWEGPTRQTCLRCNACVCDLSHYGAIPHERRCQAPPSLRVVGEGAVGA